MLNKKILAISIISLFAVSSANWAYTEVACSTDEVFNQNSCNQCFIWENKSVWSHMWFLSDKWINFWTKSMLLYKAEQEDPRMIELNWSTWNQVPDVENFWEYTTELNSKYNEENAWYVLTAWESINWLKSSEWYAYNLSKTNAANNENVWLLIYPIITHTLDWVDDISLEAIEHRECVLFKSSSEEIVVPEVPEEREPEPDLPQTGPEHILLLILAMIAWIVVFKFNRKES